ncbi:hypothetical protein DSO57_1028992 [Entomophthora muscae]|uniref:Uncharacterized protein n=2 Tax=Entomophthora muscae TaxID=34485 RepID=A0ACC2RWN4_9FUNG|nr:hypothetical protein DSO57_1014147 [Entomophthora muscae]KAJ9068416.1 hypothetical protein DSO57_1028992 [Entomophthora muscae]
MDMENCNESQYQSSPFYFSRLLLIRWEDENTHCFQVEENGVCVARRRDNDMINGTKLLNVAKMTRGKRDAILKNEPTRVVVKSGSMILKGVWVPFERAKQMAKEHKVFDMLYPLFEPDIHKIYASTLQNRRSSFIFGSNRWMQQRQEPPIMPPTKMHRVMSDTPSLLSQPVMPYSPYPYAEPSEGNLKRKMSIPYSNNMLGEFEHLPQYPPPMQMPMPYISESVEDYTFPPYSLAFDPSTTPYLLNAEDPIYPPLPYQMYCQQPMTPKQHLPYTTGG